MSVELVVTFFIMATYHQDFYATDDVHRSGKSGSDVEQEAYGAAEFGTQITGDHEIRTSRRHNAVSCYSTHANGCQHGLRGERDKPTPVVIIRMAPAAGSAPATTKTSSTSESSEE